MITWDIIVYEDMLIVGGDFTAAGNISAPRVAGWNGAEWLPWGAFDRYEPQDFVIYDGRLMAAANTTIWEWVGSEWVEFATTTGGSVGDMVIFESDLVAVGSFDTIGGQNVNAIARWSGVNWQRIGSGVGGTSSNALSTVVHQDDLIVSGSRLVGGAGAQIVGWNGDDWYQIAQEPQISSGLIVGSHGDRLFAGGIFESIGGVGARNIAQWDGQVWSPMGRGTNRRPSEFFSRADGLLVGGSFETAGLAGVRGVARWDGTQWHTIDSGNGLSAAARDVTTYEGRLIVVGSFQAAGVVAASRVAAWDGHSWARLGEGVGDSPQAAIEFEGDLVVGGSFQSGNSPHNFVARWDGASWEDMGAGLDGPVNDFTIHEGDLVAGGLFHRAVARWTGSGWETIGTGLSHGGVEVVHVVDGVLFAGGSFGTPVDNLAMWDGEFWRGLAGGNVVQPVDALGTYGGRLVVGGRFNGIGSDFLNGIGIWTGSDWEPLGAGFPGPAGSRRVTDLVEHLGLLFATGEFTETGDGPAAGAARWTGTVWRSLGSGLDGEGYVRRSIVVHGRDVYIGGAFQTAGGKPAWNLAQWATPTISWPGLDAARARTDGGFGTRTTTSAHIATIEYTLQTSTPTRLTVFDVSGRQVAVLVDGRQGPGTNRVAWDGRSLTGARVAAGVYFIRLEAGSRVERSKVLITR